MEEKFYMVYADGGRGPTYQHKTYESCEKEAKRLSAKLGCDCWILEATKRVYRSEDIATTINSKSRVIQTFNLIELQ